MGIVSKECISSNGDYIYLRKKTPSNAHDATLHAVESDSPSIPRFKAL